MLTHPVDEAEAPLNTPPFRLGRVSWWGLVAAFWSVLALLRATTRVLLYTPNQGPVEWGGALLSALLWASSWVVVTVATIALAHRHPLVRGQGIRAIVVLTTVGIAMLAARYWAVAGAGVWAGVSSQMPTLRAFLLAMVPWDLLNYFLLLGVGYAVGYYRRERLRRLETSQLQVEAAKLEGRIAVAQHQALKLQLHPQFLFTALGVVSALVRKNPAEAVRVIAHLGDLLRSAMWHGHQDEVHLEEEVRLLRSYLEIERARFGDQLSIDLDIDAPVLETFVPHLILQPLVEDAIERGVERQSGMSTIQIDIRRRGDQLRIRVSSAVGEPEEENSACIGRTACLPNITARLNSMYGPNHHVDVRHLPGGFVEVEISLPYNRSEVSRGPDESVGSRGRMKSFSSVPGGGADASGLPSQVGLDRCEPTGPHTDGVSSGGEGRATVDLPEWMFWAGFVAFWTLLGLLMAVPQVLLPAPGREAVGWIETLRITMLDMYSWGIVAIAAMMMARHVPVSSSGWVRIVGVHVLAGAAILLLRFFGANGLALWVGWIPRIRIELLPQLVPSNAVLYILMAGMGYAVDHYRRYRAGEKEAAQLRLAAASLEAKLAEAQLQSLKAQMHPHFLFNTLNAIASLVREDPDGAERMTTHLESLLRTAVSRRHEQEVTVEEELRLLRPYLEIEHVRFGDRLAVEITVEPEAESARIPDLLLQPLVENAIKHGISPRPGPGTVEVEVRRSNGDLRVRVADNGVGLRQKGIEARGEGIALANLRARLEWLYGPHHEFRLSDREGSGAEVEITIPWRPTAQHVR